MNHITGVWVCVHACVFVKKNSKSHTLKPDFLKLDTSSMSREKRQNCSAGHFSMCTNLIHIFIWDFKKKVLIITLAADA